MQKETDFMDCFMMTETIHIGKLPTPCYTSNSSRRSRIRVGMCCVLLQIRSLMKVFLELLEPLIEEANAVDCETPGTVVSSATPSQKQAAAAKLQDMRSRWEKIYADW